MTNNFNSSSGNRSFFSQIKTRGPFKARDGVIFGVTKGVANYYGWSVGISRLILIVAAIFLFFWPTIIIYLVAAMIMSPEPEKNLINAEERGIWLQAQLDPDEAMNLLSRRANQVEKRLRRMEDYVTSKDYSWNRRMSSDK